MAHLALITRTFGDVDAAEAVLEKLVEDEMSDDTKEFWNEVITAPAQMRG